MSVTDRPSLNGDASEPAPACDRTSKPAEGHSGRLCDADLARSNGWWPGTRLAGDEGHGETVIEITALGETRVLAKTISHAGRPMPGREGLWTFSCRYWREVNE